MVKLDLVLSVGKRPGTLLTQPDDTVVVHALQGNGDITRARRRQGWPVEYAAQGLFPVTLIGSVESRVIPVQASAGHFPNMPFHGGDLCLHAP